MRERTNAGYICEISKERTDDPEVDTFDLKNVFVLICRKCDFSSTSSS